MLASAPRRIVSSVGHGTNPGAEAWGLSHSAIRGGKEVLSVSAWMGVTGSSTALTAAPFDAAVGVTVPFVWVPVPSGSGVGCVSRYVGGSVNLLIRRA